MAAANESTRNLKELLAEWKLENILTHLRAEQIDVDILEMMKSPHIRLLLYNFPLGVQIRFEYNLERWRRENGRPLPLYLSEERYQQQSQMKSEVTQTDLTILDVNTNSQKNTEGINDISTSTRQSNYSNSSAAATITNKQFRINSCVSLPPGKNCIDSNSSASMPCTTKAQVALPNNDLRKILTLVPYGVELTNSYRERKSFTNAERRQLISVIVNYYLDNNIKFNLQTSYAIERSILQLFPNEKLGLYRTSKRGKLYSRYLSAKAAMKFMRGGSDPDDSDTDYGVTGGDDGFSMDNFSDDSQMLLVHNTADSMSHLDDENDDTFMEGEDEYAVDFIGEGDLPTITEGTVKPNIKILPERKPDEDLGPFENFHVPWHKIPSDIISMLEKQEKLGKRLNALSNVFVDELRTICTHVPMKVIRNVTQQVIAKYPYSFIDNDSEGIIISSSAVPLLQRMRDRINFLNRSRKRRNLC